MLRQVDMPLAEVAEVLNASVDRAAVALTAYWTKVERRIAGQRQLVELLSRGMFANPFTSSRSDRFCR